MDIVMQDSNAASFPISQHGYGTRSWISFLTLSAFVENQNQKLHEDDEAEQFILLTMEEPEAHLHPQAQRQLFEQLSHFQGQKVVSTHSPSIVAQSALADAIYFSKRDGKTAAMRYKATATKTDEEVIFREVINTRAGLLFASAVILCEGITEELALPVYFAEYFGCAPYSLGVSIVNTGGQKYLPYLTLIKDFDIPWFIFSDGETEAMQAIKTAVETVFGKDYTTMDNITILDNSDEYETYLIREGYEETIIAAICEYENDENHLDTYINQKQGQKRKQKTATKLNITVDRDYTIENGRTIALTDLCLENKTEYALPVAKKITEHTEVAKRIPAKVTEVFISLNRVIRAFPAGIEGGIE
jgi:putative ATP-dependent endonuclease of OLD family